MTLAVGFFDGVHLGHRAILKGADCALTFKNHPLSFLAPDRAPRLIMSWPARVRAIRSLGVHVTALDFDGDLANMSPERFLETLKGDAAAWSERLKIPVDPFRIRCGANWRFGKGGAGDAAWLRAHGTAVDLVPYAEHDGEPVSSTRIRRALEAGEIVAANAMLGGPYAVSGVRIAGKGLGRTLGYPTVNVAVRDENAVRLPQGVYVVECPDGARAIANYGHAPTLGDCAWKEPTWELHFLAGLPDVSDTVSFDVLRYLRPERAFASLDALKNQIASDIRRARE